MEVTNKAEFEQEFQHSSISLALLCNQIKFYSDNRCHFIFCYAALQGNHFYKNFSFCGTERIKSKPSTMYPKSTITLSKIFLSVINISSQRISLSFSLSLPFLFFCFLFYFFFFLKIEDGSKCFKANIC